MKKILQFLLLSACSTALFSCNFTKNDGETREIVDCLNRKVSIPNDPQTFACLGPGCLRQYSYFGEPEQLVGIENTDVKADDGSRPYLMSLTNRKELPIIGQGGPADKTDYEKLVELNPDVVFTSYIQDVARLDEIASRTGLNIVAIGYNSNGLFDPAIYKSFELIGDICGDAARGKAVAQYFKDARTELETLAGEGTTETGYVGCVNFRGVHGIDFTSGDFPPFDALKIPNVVHQEGVTGYLTIEKEILSRLNPDKIIIDLGGLNLLKADMDKIPEFYNLLKAFKNDEVYTILPTVSYSCNFDIALANCYYIGKVFYPEAFKNVNISEKFDEITSFLYGVECYTTVTSYYGGSYGKLGEVLK